jgi:hypothetical protein
MSKRQNIAMPIEDWLIFKRLKNHFRKYVRSVSVVSKHLLWHAVVHPNMSGSWMLRMQLENDWLTYRYPLIPMVEPEQIIPNIDKQKICLSKCLSKDVSGLSPRELIFICALVNCLKPKTIFEFGTSLGRTTYNLSINSQKIP